MTTIEVSDQQIQALLPAIAAREEVLNAELASIYKFYGPMKARPYLIPVADELRNLLKVRAQLTRS